MTGLQGVQSELATLFEPQVEQLGMRLERSGGLWTGLAQGGVARGEMWLCSPLPDCLVLVHDVTPLGNMRLLEESTGPYLCACSLFDDARACSRSCGLPLRSLGGERPFLDAPERRAAGTGEQELATFFEREARAHESDLLAGRSYRSRSIILLPGFFDELERRYPGEFDGVPDLFDGARGEAVRPVVERALGAIPDRPSRRPGEELELASVVHSLAAGLAACRCARRADDPNAELAREATRAILEAIDRGERPPSAGELARRLYVSRSRLCAVFKEQVGEGVGAYARHTRLERAQELLQNDRLAVSQVAALLGYPSASAFDHAFSQALGMSPRAWREAGGR